MIKVSRFDVADYLKTKEDIACYLECVLEENDQELLIKTIGDILRSEGYAKIAKQTNETRQGLYKSFSGKVKPRFETVYKTLDSLGLRFSVVPKSI